MSERAPYSRVYWSIRDDEKFDAIRGDDHHLATWLRLLIAADMAYPASADVPATARRASVTALVDAGLIDIIPGGMFRVKGLAAERARRGWDRKGPTPSLDRTLDKATDKTETRQDETSKAETPRDPADIYYQLTAKYPGDKVLPWIDDLTGRYGSEAVIRHMVAAHIEDRAPSTLLGRTTDRLRAEARELDRKERAAEKASLEQKRALPKTVEPWREEFRAAIEQKYRNLEDVA